MQRWTLDLSDSIHPVSEKQAKQARNNIVEAAYSNSNRGHDEGREDQEDQVMRSLLLLVRVRARARFEMPWCHASMLLLSDIPGERHTRQREGLEVCTIISTRPQHLHSRSQRSGMVIMMKQSHKLHAMTTSNLLLPLTCSSLLKQPLRPRAAPVPCVHDPAGVRSLRLVSRRAIKSHLPPTHLATLLTTKQRERERKSHRPTSTPLFLRHCLVLPTVTSPSNFNATW
jgi:hypothetical protein